MINRDNCIHKITDNTAENRPFEAWTNEGRKASKRTKEENIVAAIKDNRFLVRVNQKYQLFDPYNSDSIKRDQKLVKKTNENPYRMVETTDVAYEYYLKYLKGREPGFLRLAQSNIDPTKMGLQYKVMTKDESMANDELKNLGLIEIKDNK